MKMKHVLAITILFSIHALFLRGVIAQDSTQWKLPEGAKARFGKGWIQSISFSPDGTRIAAASSAGIWIYDAHTGAELALLAGHEGGVGSVAFSPDSKTLASGGYGEILLWDVETGKTLKSFKGHKGRVAVVFPDDGKTLISLSTDGSVRFRDITTGQEKRVFQVTPSLGIIKFFYALIGQDATSRHIHLDKINENGILALGYRKGVIQLKDATTGKHLKTLRGHKDYVNQLAISPDGSLLAVDIFNAPLSLWDIATGRQLKTLGESVSLGGKFEFSKDGKTFIYQTSFHGIELWDVATGTLRATLGKDKPEINVLTFSPDAKAFVGGSSDGSIRFWDADTGAELSVLTTGHTQGVNALVFSPDGNTLAGGYSKMLQLWDMNTFTPRADAIESTDKLITLAFSPDGRTVTSAGDFTFTRQKRDEFRKESVTGELSVWDASTGHNRAVFPIESHKGEAPVLPGQRAGSSSSRAMGYTFIMDVKTANGIKKHVKLQIHGTAAFSQDGAMLAVAQNSSLATGNNRFSILLWDIPSQQLQFTFKGHEGKIKALRFAPDGKTLASGSKDGTIRLWNTTTGDQTASFSADMNTALAFSPDSKTLASIYDDKRIKLWDINTGEELMTLKGNIGICHALAFSADSKILASGSHDGTILTWDLATGTKLTTLKGHDNWIKALTFSPDGKTLASGSEDGVIFLWNILP